MGPVLRPVKAPVWPDNLCGAQSSTSNSDGAINGTMSQQRQQAAAEIFSYWQVVEDSFEIVTILIKSMHIIFLNVVEDFLCNLFCLLKAT